MIVAALLPRAGPAADAGIPPDAAGASRTVPLDIGSQLQLLVDMTLIEKLEGKA